MSPFSAALRRLRIERGISQGALAKQLGIDQARLSALECGTKQPKDCAALIPRIVEALRLSESQASSLRAALEASSRFYAMPTARHRTWSARLAATPMRSSTNG